MKTIPRHVQIYRMLSLFFVFCGPCLSAALGRWAVFRDSPDWFVHWMYWNFDFPDEDEFCEQIMDQIDEEWELRKMRRARSRPNQRADGSRE